MCYHTGCQKSVFTHSPPKSVITFGCLVPKRPVAGLPHAPDWGEAPATLSITWSWGGGLRRKMIIRWMRSLEKRKEIRRVIIFLAFYRVIQRDNLGQQQAPTNTKLQTLPNTHKRFTWMFGGSYDIEWPLLESFGVWWCILLSSVVWRCEEGVWGVS